MYAASKKKDLDVDIRVKKHKPLSLQPVSLHYGNGFVINKRWTRNIHRCWKVSNRVSALQLNTNKKEYECVSDENSINLKLQTKKSYTCILVATSNT